MKNLFAILLLNVISFGAFGQIGNEYEIINVDFWKDFERLTLFEEEYHNKIEKQNARTDRMYLADSLYMLESSKERRKFLYEQYELKQRVNLKENRARYFVEHFEQDSILMDKTFSKTDTISTACICELKNDSIQIKMAIWLFGGSLFDLTIKNQNFELVYIESAHKMEPFKYQESDSTFVEELELNISNSSLKVSDEIKSKIGEQINGYLKFESPEYFIDSWFRGYASENKLKRGVTKGEIYFTCKLREPFNPIKE